MKSLEEGQLLRALLNRPPLTPLEERVLRMLHGAAVQPNHVLNDASGGQSQVFYSLAQIERSILSQTGKPAAASTRRRGHLKLVPPKER